MAELHYQPFSRESFDGISSLQLLPSNDSKVFLLGNRKIFLKTWQLISRILCTNEDNSFDVL